MKFKTNLVFSKTIFFYRIASVTLAEEVVVVAAVVAVVVVVVVVVAQN